jgi:glycosyltransferase involved in cell wall biosynthesis
MAAHHGAAGGRVARDALEGRRPPPWQDDAEVVEYPLDTEALAFATGAVTHSLGHARSLRERWLGPVAALAHPCYRAVLDRAVEREPAPRADGRLQLTTVGHLIANKNVEHVVEILAADPALAARVHYSIVGEADAGGAQAARIDELLRGNRHVSAELPGWLDEGELDRLMAATDVFVNLRHPVLESGSGSLARELAHGRAILCFDGGSFGELPEGAAARVPAGDFAAAAVELRRLVGDREHRDRVAERARALAAERTETRYAAGLIELIERSRRASPSLRLIDRAATELGAMRADPELPVYDRIAGDIGRALIF